MSFWRTDGKGIRPGGHVGGDNQATDSYSVRYHHATKTDAVVTVYGYGVETVGGDSFAVEIQTELTICSDRRDPGGTEQWSDTQYATPWTRYGTPADADRAAKKAIQRHRPSDVRWDGRAPWER